MRTTIDLPTDLHRRLRREALERNVSMSRLAVELLTSSLEMHHQPVIEKSSHGLPVVRFGRPVTSAEVAEALDEDL